jgi:hypothetical protein
MADISNRGINNLKQLFKRVSYLEQKLAATQINTNSAAAHYLVKAPSEGIPGIEGIKPGYALCEMVRRFSADGQTEKDLADMATVQPVYNLGEDIAPGEIVIAHRDTFGDLFIPVGADDPDTPFRNTIDFFPLSTDALRGSPLSILDMTDDPTNTDLALGGSVSNLSSAVATGTVSFLRNFVESDDGIEQQQKTNNGGITPAIVYIQHASHNYCVADSKSGTNHRALISCPYGPWRIIKKVPLTELEADVPYYALATIKEQQYDRTIMKMDVESIADLGTDATKKIITFSGHGVGEIDAGLYNEFTQRFGYESFTELGIGSSSVSLGTVWTRSWFIEFSPSQLYLFDFYLRGYAQFDYEDIFTINDTTPTGHTFKIYSEKQLTANVYGRLNSGTWEKIATERVHLSYQQVNVDELLTNQAEWSVHLTCPWIEKHKDVRIELEEGVGTLGGITISTPVGGYVLIHRLGDRGNFAGYGTRSWSTFSPGTIPTPVLEP